MNREEREAAAEMWGATGRAYDEMSFMVSDALAHAAQLLQVQRAEAVLDVATGTGWTARNLARSGAEVTAIDVAEEMIAGAIALSTHVYPPIAFRINGPAQTEKPRMGSPLSGERLMTSKFALLERIDSSIRTEAVPSGRITPDVTPRERTRTFLATPSSSISRPLTSRTPSMGPLASRQD